jgi:hypothetical protein
MGEAASLLSVNWTPVESQMFYFGEPYGQALCCSIERSEPINRRASSCEYDPQPSIPYVPLIE